jgi:hypothetical protein
MALAAKAKEEHRQTKLVMAQKSEPTIVLTEKGLAGHINVDLTALSGHTTRTTGFPKGDMLVNSIGARFDGHCKVCHKPIAAGDEIAGVRPSFYETSPLRWMCMDCGKLYEQAYQKLMPMTGTPSQTELINAGGAVILTFEWDDIDDKWLEIRTTQASARRRP